jgi:nucleoside-diphosphate-sugar epimerase
MKIYITSGGSYVGMALVKYLLMHGHNVIYTFNEYSPKVDHSQCFGLRKNFLSIESEKIAVIKKFCPDVVINCTGLFQSPRYSDSTMLSANIFSSIFCNEILLHRPEAKIIHLSSTSVYGWPLPSNQDIATPNPSDNYGRSKLAQEELTMMGENDFAVNIRLPVVLGMNAHRAWLPTVKEKMLKNEDISFYNGHDVYTTFTTLSSLMQFISELMVKDGIRKTFPIGGESSWSVNEVLSYISKKIGTKSKIFETKSSSHISQIRSLEASTLGYKPPKIKDALDEFLGDIRL